MRGTLLAGGSDRGERRGTGRRGPGPREGGSGADQGEAGGLQG